MKTKNLIIAFLMCCSLPFCTYGQEVETEVIRSDADLTSGNYKEVFTSLFQLGFKDLTGDDKRFQFSSNLFALRLKANPNLNIDKAFARNTFFRNSNLNLDIKLDSHLRFNGAGLGYKLALINRRDYAISKKFALNYLTGIQDLSALSDYIEKAASKLAKQDRTLLSKYVEDLNNFFAGDITYGGLNNDLKQLMNDELRIPLNDTFNFNKSAKEIYDSLVDSYNSKLLWTIDGKVTTYNDALKVSNIDFTSQATSSLVKIGKFSNLEFDIKANYKIGDDTSKVGRSLNRHVLSSELGLNWVFRGIASKKSYLELEVSSTLNRIIRTNYKNEDKTNFTLNGTLRVRVTDNVWIPITFKYDPVQANVLGTLSIKTNFAWFDKLLRK